MNRDANTARNASPPPPLGSIRRGEITPKRVFCGRLGVGEKAWRQLLEKGLPTIRVGKQALVDGDAAIDFFRRLGDGE